jgi:hypothetical protein
VNLAFYTADPGEVTRPRADRRPAIGTSQGRLEQRGYVVPARPTRVSSRAMS